MSTEIKSRAFALDPTFNYLPEQDRYLLALGNPSLKFNVIGVGVNGQEHILVTYLEGRAAIHGIYDPNPSSVAAARQIPSSYPRSL